ncbi:MAG: M50 family metallopeptidase [Christensenellales bacterium]|jgi:regulator of sigma E protease
MFSLSSLSNVFSSILYIVIAILILLTMVLIHELGHYIAGRILKFKINEFAIGFGKTLFQRTNKRGEKISLRLFPLGGFCAFEGEGDGESDEIKPESFNSHKPWKRIIVYMAGPLFNILSAVLFSFVLLMGVGYDIPQIAGVDKYYANSEVFEVGDVIYEVNGTKINFANGNTFTALISQYTAEDDIEMTVKRDGNIITLNVKLQQAFDKDNNLVFTEDGKPVYKLGIQTIAYKHTFGEALVRAVPFTLGLSWIVLKGLVMALTFQLPAGSMSGPIGAIGIMSSQIQQSFSSILVLLPLIAVNLGVFNLLPIPALDGSHIVFNIIEWIRKKPINRDVEAYIHFFGFIALIALIIFMDVMQLFV